MVFKLLSTLTLAQAGTSVGQRLTEALGLTVVGMLVVFTALSLTALVIILLNLWDRSTAKPATGTGSAVKLGRPDQQLIIVLAAAAATALLGKNVQVRDIQPAPAGTAGAT